MYLESGAYLICNRLILSISYDRDKERYTSGHPLKGETVLHMLVELMLLALLIICRYLDLPMFWETLFTLFVP